jgi:GNAT superfamily N-acetyltransferase
MDFFTLTNDLDWAGLIRERDSIYLLGVTHQAPFCFFAEADGRPVGVLMGNVAPDRSRAYVQCLAVTPAWQRRGIGTKLMLRFEEECRRWGVPQVWLFGTAPIYAKLGYRECLDYFPPEVMKYVYEVKKNKVQVKELSRG